MTPHDSPLTLDVTTSPRLALMSTVPQMQIYALRSVVPAIRAAGGKPEEIFARVGMTLQDLDDVDRRVPTMVGFDLAKAASELTGDAHFGLHWGQSEKLSTLGAVGYVMLHSPNLEASLRGFCRFLDLVYEGLDAHLHVEPETAAVRYRPAREVPLDLRHDNEYAMAFVVRLIRTLVSPDWRPERIEFRHAKPDDTGEYARWLDVSIRFGADFNAVVFPRALLDHENGVADESLLPILERHVSDLRSKTPTFGDFLGRVNAEILELLPSGDVTVQSVAAKLGMGVRTLQRRLREVDTQFKDLVEDARQVVSVRYLQDTDVPLTEIAFLTGYSEVSAFTRAFRRWKGTTPIEFRRRRGA